MNATDKCESAQDMPRVGDVWQSDPAGRKAKVTNIEPRKQTIGGWCGFILLATNARRTASIKAFVKGRKLVGRGGVGVGETRVDGAVTYRVLSIAGDDARVEGPTGPETRSLAALAVLARPEEPAKVKAKPAAEVPRKGDVWGSAGGRNRVEVTEITTGHWPHARWVSTNVRGLTGVCGLKRFVRERVLLERDGKPVRRIVPPTLREQVAEFHAAFDIPAPAFPSVPPEARVRLRASLVFEEFLEWMEAVFPSAPLDDIRRQLLDIVERWPTAVNMPMMTDALADLDYVVEGTRLEFGVNGAPIAAAVHAANMAKLGPDGKPVFRDDGKVLKPEGWQPADIVAELRKQGWEG